jgi:hypothetical protein
MKFLKDREEIAKAINGREIPVVTLDLVDADEYGLVSEPVAINNGFFRDGFPYMIHAHIRCYSDAKKFTFSSGCVGIHSDFGYTDVMEMLEYRNAPVIEADSDVILVIKDSKEKMCYITVMHTSKGVDPHCYTPLTFTDGDSILNKTLLDKARKYTREGRYLGEGA